MSTLLSGENTLFIVDDMISDETLDKKQNSLLELAISGRHRRHSLWLLTQSYTAIPKNQKSRNTTKSAKNIHVDHIING